MRWSRDELLIVLNLYHKLPFGKVSSRQPVIIDLAKKMGRTPASISMKLGNLASFDPAHQSRGVRGLTGASELDRTVWDEFHANPAEMAPLSQQRFDALFVEPDSETTEVIPGVGVRARCLPPAETEAVASSKRRRGQDFFREIVLNNYGNCCALTGLPVRDLLVASHILPWAGHERERLNVRNGICLNRLHDAAFDRGLIGFDDDLRLILSRSLVVRFGVESVDRNFAEFEKRSLVLPEDGFPPEAGFLAAHRRKFSLS